MTDFVIKVRTVSTSFISQFRERAPAEKLSHLFPDVQRFSRAVSPLFARYASWHISSYLKILLAGSARMQLLLHYVVFLFFKRIRFFKCVRVQNECVMGVRVILCSYIMLLLPTHRGAVGPETCCIPFFFLCHLPPLLAEINIVSIIIFIVIHIIITIIIHWKIMCIHTLRCYLCPLDYCPPHISFESVPSLGGCTDSCIISMALQNLYAPSFLFLRHLIFQLPAAVL